VGAIENVWKNVVTGGYMILLDGFSRVPFCSTEGRALMSMDLASYSSGTSRREVSERLEGHAGASPPPIITTDRGMAYVDTCVKVFYFPAKVSYHPKRQKRRRLRICTCTTS
jgi:hypothetical protein